MQGHLRVLAAAFSLCAYAGLACCWAPAACAQSLDVVVAASDQPQCIAVAVTGSAERSGGVLVEREAPENPLPVQWAPQVAADGKQDEGQLLLAVVPPRAGASGQRHFRWQASAAADSPASPMRWSEQSETTWTAFEGPQSVLAYNHGTMTGERVPECDPRRTQSCYIHPLWGLDGEVLTDDFPADHFHHHGVFWTWPHVEIDGEHYDLWASQGGIKQKFIKWLYREAGPVAAVLGVENGWFVGDRQVMTERIWVRAFRAADAARSIDLDMVFVPGDRPVSLKGSEGKSYGGLTVRFAVWPRRDAVIRVPDRTLRHVGNGQASAEDLPDTPLPWADLTSQFPGAGQRSGGAVFIPPDHPDYPPTWLVRCYGPLCVGWPGVAGREFAPGEPFALSYRLWLHKTEQEHDVISGAYEAYCHSRKAAVESPAAP